MNFNESNTMKNIYSNKGRSSKNNRNEDNEITPNTLYQQLEEQLHPKTARSQSPDHTGFHLYYILIVNN